MYWTASLIYLLILAITLASAKIGHFWHITDIHLDLDYTVGGDTKRNCRRSSSSGHNFRPAAYYGDYNCDAPWELVRSAVKAMEEKHGEIEFILWTGDAVSELASYSSEQQFKALSNVTDILNHYFSSHFVIPVLGHDDPGASRGGRYSYTDLGHLFEKWLPPDAISTFNKGGYYTFDQKKSKVRLVALNTNLFSTSTTSLQEGREEVEAQWRWFEAIMNKAEKKNERVFIIGHMAPGADEKQYDALPGFSEKFSSKYLRLVRKHAGIIVGQFFGHLHSDTFRIVYDESKPVSWMMMAPSVSPRRIPSGNNNPGIRIYKYDTVTGAVLDFSQYYLDLSEANGKHEAVWQLEYNLTSYYGLNQLTPRALHELAQSFTLANSLLFERYHRAYAVSFNHHHQGCDSNCRHTHYCAITKLEFSEFRNCLETAAHALASSNNHQQRNAQLASLLLVLPVLLSRLL